MPILPPALDDRSFEDLVSDMLRRIPAHTPEWTHPSEGDPGRTLIDLFAWLADTILYRANLIPERQRLAFLRLLGSGMRPAIAARGMVQLSIREPKILSSARLPAGSVIERPVHFETESEVVVHAVEGLCFLKRRPTSEEGRKLRDIIPDLRELYGIRGQASAYVTTQLFGGPPGTSTSIDIAADSIDRCLWIALLAPTPDAQSVSAVRAALGGGVENRRLTINIGVAPTIAMPETFDDIGVRARIPHVWEINTGRGDGADYLPLDAIADGSAGLTRTGVIRLLLPGKDDIGAPTNDVLQQARAGVGDRPPRIDDPLIAARLVTWIRLRPDSRARLSHLRLEWAGVNAVAVEQKRTSGRVTIGQGTGASGLELSLGATSIDAASLMVDVEEEEGMRTWRLVPDTAIAGRDDRVFSLDQEAGSIRFGDGVRGMAPGLGRVIQIVRMRSGGGQAGNLPPGSIKTIAALPEVPALNVVQPLATVGGADAETLAAAEARIPAMIRHGGRAVTGTDYKELALRTPGVSIGRVEILERFKPQQRRSNVPGVVSVMVMPQRETIRGPAPRADRPILESVHAWLDERRPLATELYVIGCDYVPIGLSASVELVDSRNREAVLDAVAEAIRLFLWPLQPGGPDGLGWPLGRTIDDRMIETAIGRVAGVRAVAPVRLFTQSAGKARWQPVPEDSTGRGRIRLQRWQLPELVMLSVAEGDTSSPTLPPSFAAAGEDAVAIPVVPEVC